MYANATEHSGINKNPHYLNLTLKFHVQQLNICKCNNTATLRLCYRELLPFYHRVSYNGALKIKGTRV